MFVRCLAGLSLVASLFRPLRSTKKKHTRNHYTFLTNTIFDITAINLVYHLIYGIILHLYDHRFWLFRKVTVLKCCQWWICIWLPADFGFSLTIVQVTVFLLLQLLNFMVRTKETANKLSPVISNSIFVWMFSSSARQPNELERKFATWILFEISRKENNYHSCSECLQMSLNTSHSRTK